MQRIHFREKVSWVFSACLLVNCSTTGLLWWFYTFLFGAPTPAVTWPTRASLPWLWLPALGPVRICHEPPQSAPEAITVLAPSTPAGILGDLLRRTRLLHPVPSHQTPGWVPAVGHSRENPCLGREVSEAHPWITVLLRSLTLFPLSEHTLLRQLKMTLDIPGKARPGDCTSMGWD